MQPKRRKRNELLNKHPIDYNKFVLMLEEEDYEAHTTTNENREEANTSTTNSLMEDSSNSPTTTSATLTPDTSDYEASVDVTPCTPANTPSDDEEEEKAVDPQQLNEALSNLQSSLIAFNNTHPTRPQPNQESRNQERYKRNLSGIKNAT